jgi:hypothetical protein
MAATVLRLPRTLGEYELFDGGANRSTRRKPVVRDPCRKSLLYGATYLVLRAGIELTPRTDIDYRPVSQTRQTRRKPFFHHVPQTVWCMTVVQWLANKEYIPMQNEHHFGPTNSSNFMSFFDCILFMTCEKQIALPKSFQNSTIFYFLPYKERMNELFIIQLL